MGYSPTLGIGHYSQSPRTVGEDSAGAVIGKQEDHGRAGHRLMIFVFDLDDGLPRRPLADIVNGAIPFHNDQVELTAICLGRKGSAPICTTSKQDKPAARMRMA